MALLNGIKQTFYQSMAICPKAARISGIRILNSIWRLYDRLKLSNNQQTYSSWKPSTSKTLRGSFPDKKTVQFWLSEKSRRRVMTFFPRKTLRMYLCLCLHRFSPETVFRSSDKAAFFVWIKQNLINTSLKIIFFERFASLENTLFFYGATFFATKNSRICRKCFGGIGEQTNIYECFFQNKSLLGMQLLLKLVKSEIRCVSDGSTKKT